MSTYSAAGYPMQSNVASWTRPDPKNLIHALDVMSPPDVIANILKTNPETIKEKGFNGQGVLHRAVLCASIDTLLLLLKYDADPNACNSHGETPVHFACKMVNPQFVHALLQHGGNIAVMDNGGNTPLCLAFHTGSVYVLQYMSTVCQLSLQSDPGFPPPLQIVASHGHTDALMWLLRKERADIFECDKDGNTALHAAAARGYAKLCWILLERGGSQICNMRNKDGQTALDLAARGTLHIHTVTAGMLKKYSTVQGAIGGPVWMWRQLLIAPAVLYACILLLGHAVGTSYGGYAIFIGALALVYYTNLQGHRLRHISDWPNPLPAGMFGAGLVLTSAVFFFSQLPVLMDTHVGLCAFSIPATILMFYWYRQLLTSDPGRLRQNLVKECTGEPYSILDIASRNLNPDSFCGGCELTVPVQTKHCKLCVVCYAKMDHHCLFLYTCIAKNNHRLFVRFLLLVVLGMLLFVYTSCVTLKTLYNESTPGLYAVDSTLADLISFTFHNHHATWSLMVMNLISSLWLIQNIRLQFHTISKGQTMYFATACKSKMSRWARMRNVCNFLLGKQLYAVETKDKVNYLM